MTLTRQNIGRSLFSFGVGEIARRAAVAKKQDKDTAALIGIVAGALFFVAWPHLADL